MKKFQYQLVVDPDRKIFISKLNEMGKEGWRVIRVFSLGGSFFSFFSRALLEREVGEEEEPGT